MPVNDLLILLDADVLAYELSAIGQYYKEDDEGNKETELTIRSFEFVRNHLERRVLEIMEVLDTRLEPIMYLSGEGNFREVIAKRKGYKENRKGIEKPYHLENTKAYIKSRYNTYESRGCEADDLLCISQMESLQRTGYKYDTAETVIVTRDKDLRQCMGWHYGWECGQQPEYSLRWIDEIGTLESIYKEGTTPKGRISRRFAKLTGTGLKWFYAQVLTGDVVDNIPGLPKVGPKRAFELLDSCNTEEEMLDVTIEAYKGVYESSWETELIEQVHLVWMIRERNPDGSLKWWEWPDGYSYT